MGSKGRLLITFQAFKAFPFWYLGGLVTYWAKEVTSRPLRGGVGCCIAFIFGLVGCVGGEGVLEMDRFRKS